ncbi:MAG: DUF5717 family protein [Lachnospiraceae bacterium]|nr:DUF5717 family protein [Lachnospiraceae bacterium]
MRKRIEQLLNGVFEYEADTLQLSAQELRQEVTPDSVLTGSFVLSCESERRVKGFVYSSSPRVTFDPPRFAGRVNEIRYQVDLAGLSSMDQVTGQFTLSTDVGEYFLPYCFTVAEKTSRKKEEMISREDFLCLAKENPLSARELFGSQKMRSWIRESAPEQARILARAMQSSPDRAQALEEFLIGSGLKEPVEILLDEWAVTIDRPEQPLLRSARLSMSGWGYMALDISSDSPFLRIEKKRVTTDEFVGGQYVLEYIVDTEQMHAGNNYGRICISTCYQTLYLDVTVEGREESEHLKNLRIQKLMRCRLLGLYTDLRLKRTDMRSWIEHSQTVLNGYKKAGGEDVFADLFQIQLYFADGKLAKGTRLLEELEQNPYRFHTQEQYAFYLYLSTFFDRDTVYVDQVQARIEQLFLQMRDSWVIQWILLFLQERYLKDEAARIEAIRIQSKYGCCSPILYLEAALVFVKNPYLLRRLDDFERNVLLYAAKQHILTEELSFRIASLALQRPAWERKLFRVLQECWNRTHSDEVLTAICSMLIAGDQKKTEYFSWYAQGVARDLHITGLYEYYMETMDSVGIEKMPQIIRMYFAYNTSLDYRRKAAIYRNISDNRDSVPQVYRSCRTGIEHFVVEMLSLGRLDQNLAVLYERFITRKMLTRSLAEKLIRLLFTFEVTCKNPQMKSVVVCHPQLGGDQIRPLSGGRAQVQIYTEDARIFLADENGNRFASTSLYRARRLLDSPLLMKYCREIIPEHAALVLYDTGSCGEVTAQNLESCKIYCRMEEVREERRMQMRRRILEYYRAHPMEEELYDFLREINLQLWIRADKRILMSLLTQEGLYEQAYSLLKTYGSEQVDPMVLVRICSQNVLLREYEEDTELIAYCHECLECGKYDDHILTYLISYYDGPLEDMKKLWYTAHLNELDTIMLEGKILSLILFTRSGSSGADEIFASYQRKLGRRKICQAYLNYRAYEYLVRNLPVGEVIFASLEQACLEEAPLEDVACLALLQYYSGKRDLGAQREKLVRQMLSAYSSRGIRMAFFKKFPRRLRVACRLEDKVFMEYVANPEHVVTVYSRKPGQEQVLCEPMVNVFEGIFVSEFVLFNGESLECWLEETKDGKLLRRTDARVLAAASSEEIAGSRYALLSKMSAEQKAGQDKALSEDLDLFYQMDLMTQEVFTLV